MAMTENYHGGLALMHAHFLALRIHGPLVVGVLHIDFRTAHQNIRSQPIMRLRALDLRIKDILSV
jgi:hypothetical protein